MQDAADRARKENPGDKEIGKLIFTYQANDPIIKAIAKEIKRRSGK